jgi:hypothetical protein
MSKIRKACPGVWGVGLFGQVRILPLPQQGTHPVLRSFWEMKIGLSSGNCDKV